MARILGVDYGQARVGFAYSDERRIIATPWEVFSRKTSFKEIQAKMNLVGSFDLLVVGLPLLLNGKEDFMAQEARKYGEALSDYLKIPCLFWDERFSSSFAHKLMKEDSLSRKKRTALADTLAATLILQNYLDSLTPPSFFS